MYKGTIFFANGQKFDHHGWQKKMENAAQAASLSIMFRYVGECRSFLPPEEGTQEPHGLERKYGIFGHR